MILLNWLTIEPHGCWSLCLLGTRVIDTQPYSIIYVGARDPNSGPWAYMISTLLIEPSPKS